MFIEYTVFKIEGIIMIAKLVQNFDFELDPSQKFIVTQETTLRPKGGVRCFVKLRC